ncbi:major facilitator superfamily transporter [Ceratobasidium sp. AG-Ba]|nr:major facilitator superfamily transporter [Ceratobasidium sp. AG-Ba]
MSFVPPSLPKGLSSEPVSPGIHVPPASHPYERDVVLRHIGDEHPDEDHVSDAGTRTGVTTDLEDAGKVTLVEWDANDPENPRNLSRLRKWVITLLSSSLCLSVALGSSIVTGDIPGPMEEFQVSEEVVNLTVTLFVVGFGVGPLVFAPLSEILGRYPVYCISMGLYFIFTLPSALAPNIGCLIASRALAGIASSAPMTNVGGTLADIWDVEDRGFAMAVFSVSIFMGPCIGPIVGGFIGETVGWRWIYWVLFIFVGVVFVATVFLMPETLSPVLLRRRAQRLREKTGDMTLKTESELHHVSLAEKVKISLTRPLILLVTEPLLICMSGYLTFIYSLLYLFFFAYPIVLIPKGLNAGEIGLTFIGVMAGIFIAMLLLPVQEKAYLKVCSQRGVVPEARLPFMMFGSVLLPFSLFIFAWTSLPHVHWIGPTIAGVPFGAAMVTVYISANSYIIDTYQRYTASAVAAKTFLRSIVGATVPLWVNQMYAGMKPQWASTLLAFLAILAMPIPFIFFRYGDSIRARSTKAN